MPQSSTTINPEPLLKTATAEALDLLRQAFTEARKSSATATSEGMPPLFPRGVELIHVKCELALNEFVRVGAVVEIGGLNV